MSLFKAVISLVVVSLVATAFAATEGQESITFAEWSANAAGATQANIAGSYYKKSADVKHLCLKEMKQGDCRYVGCSGIVNCPYNEALEASDTTTPPECPNCWTHVAGLSDVECCKDQDYYPKETEEASAPTITPLTAGKVGTCDWDADLFTKKECATPSEDNTNCGFIALANGAFQIGTAWATCYLNAGAEECGHPFCDRMVLSFQGGMYAVPAYSKTNVPLEGVVFNYSSPFTVDFPFLGDENSTEPLPGGCFVAPPTPTLPEEELSSGNGGRNARANSPIRAVVKKATGKKASANKHQAALSRSLNKKLAAIRGTMLKKGAAKNANKHVSKKTTQKRGPVPAPTPTGHEYYSGMAVMFSGAVTVTSLDKHVEYSHGLMEYVPLFNGFNEDPIVGKPSATALVVKPNTYNIQLVAGPKSEGYKSEGYKGEGYKGAEEYKGDAGRGYYKGGEGQGY